MTKEEVEKMLGREMNPMEKMIYNLQKDKVEGTFSVDENGGLMWQTKESND